MWKCAKKSRLGLFHIQAEDRQQLVEFNELLSVLTSRLFPSPPEEEFTIHASGVPCSMQAKPGPKPHPTCIAMAELWFAKCAKSKLAGSLGGDAARRSGKGTPHRRLRWHGHVERSLGWLKKVQKLNPIGGRGRGRPKKTWTAVIDMDCLALGLTETHPTDRKAWSGRCAVTLDTPLY